MKLVNHENLDECISEILKETYISCDTETTGLRPYQGDRLFSIIISTLKEDYYFNFQDYEDGSPCIPKDFIRTTMEPIFQGERCIFFANAKFDMHMLWQEGVEITCTVHDVLVSARLIKNDYLKYSLEECSIRELGEKKDDAPKIWCIENDAWEWELIPGKKMKKKKLYFWKVPFHIISIYGCMDARLTLRLGIKHITEICLYDDTVDGDKYPKRPKLWDVLLMERQLTKTCFKIERTGIKIDRAYCEEAIEFETRVYQTAAERFKEETGQELIDSGKHLAPIFENLGYKVLYKETKTEIKDELGNTVGEKIAKRPIVDDAFLASLDSPVARFVQIYRESYKRCNTYFRSFLYFADKEGVIHADMRQAGTATGRFSYKDPNLQNLTANDNDLKYPVRRAFIPRPGCLFVMLDYKQMEFRMLLDYAGEMGLIDKILKGHDPHQATADLTDLDRSSAKTISFGLLYGMGIPKLSADLNVTKDKAKKLKAKYFSALEKVEDLIFYISKTAENRGYLFDWLGRVFMFPDKKFSYKGTNAVIQGGAADVVKMAMNSLDLALPKYGIQMLVQVHDELLFEVPNDSVEAVGLIKQTMETTYPHRFIPLTCSISHSLKSWGEDEDGLPTDGEKERNIVQGKNLSTPESLDQFLGGKSSTAIH